MAFPNLRRPPPSRVVIPVLWVGVVVALAWITWVCLTGRVVQAVSPSQIAGTATVGRVFLPDLEPADPGEAAPRIFEDDRALGPRLDELIDVPRMGGGTYAVAYEAASSPNSTLLHFTASDGSDPRSNGRRYSVRYPRRQRPGTIPLLLGAWIVLPAVALRWTRAVRVPRPARAPSPTAAGWAVAVLGLLYSVFALQAWLGRSNVDWLLALAAVAMPPFLSRLGPGWSRDPALRLPGWLPWLAGLLAWVAITSAFGSSYGAPMTAAAFIVVCVGGVATHFGLRGALGAGAGFSILPGLLLVASGLSLARDAGFDYTSDLAAFGLSAVWPSRPVNPWTTKFLAHWLLMLSWCVVLALARRRQKPGRGEVLVPVAGLVAIWVGGSSAALAALFSSAAVAVLALRWPRRVRQLVVFCLACGMLMAPLLAAVPWHARGELATKASPGVLRVLDIDNRAAKWEFSRQLTALRPWTGWGFGASPRLPGGDLSAEEALGSQRGVNPPSAPSGPVMAGGHPHNAALLVWLDLGVVGALLVAGLVWATGRSIARFEKEPRIHGALLGLLIATGVYLLFNYPVWEPEVLSILWMSVVLPGAVLSRPPERSRRLVHSGIAVLLILVLGGVVTVQERLARAFTVREIRASEVVLGPDARHLAIGGDRRDLRYGGALDAGAVLVEGTGTPAVIRGWAFALGTTGKPEAVLVFVGSDLVGAVWPEQPTPDVFRRSEGRDIRALTAGFEVAVDTGQIDLSAPVTIVALQNGVALAAELPSLTGE